MNRKMRRAAAAKSQMTEQDVIQAMIDLEAEGKATLERDEHGKILAATLTQKGVLTATMRQAATSTKH